MNRAVAVIAALTFVVAACSGGSSHDSARLCNPTLRKCGPGDVTVQSPRFYKLFGATDAEAKCLAAATPVNGGDLSAAQVSARAKCVPSPARARELDRRLTDYMSKHLGKLGTPRSN
jgi:hypothetical protein